MVSRGTRTERAVTKELVDHGYLIGSRRHLAGAGDLLAWLPRATGAALWRPALVEVKGTLDPPWRASWGPEDRQEMIDTGHQFHLEPLLAWRPPGLGATIWLPSEDWPK